MFSLHPIVQVATKNLPDLKVGDVVMVQNQTPVHYGGRVQPLQPVQVQDERQWTWIYQEQKKNSAAENLPWGEAIEDFTTYCVILNILQRLEYFNYFNHIYNCRMRVYR